MGNPRECRLQSGDEIALTRQPHQDWTHLEIKDGNTVRPIPREKVLAMNDTTVTVLWSIYEWRRRNEDKDYRQEDDDDVFEPIFIGEETRTVPRLTVSFSHRIEAKGDEVWTVFDGDDGKVQATRIG